MHQFKGGYFKVDCILETNFTFPEQSGTDLWDTIEDHKATIRKLKTDFGGILKPQLNR